MNLSKEFEDTLARLLVEFADCELLGDEEGAKAFANEIYYLCERLLNDGIEHGKQLNKREATQWLSN